MNREILFRGKRKDTAEWVEGDLLHLPDGIAILANGYATVLPETVGQYTGLTDKNGKKIFEGDILSAFFDDEFPENETRVKVQWRDLAWCTCQSGCSPDHLEPSEDRVWTIIGNIYDNPELIKERECGELQKG